MKITHEGVIEKKYIRKLRDHREIQVCEYGSEGYLD